MLIDRADNAISICEMKFYKEEVSLTKDMAQQLRRRTSLFRRKSKTKKQLFIVLVTPYGLLPNVHSLGLVDAVVTMDDLFRC
jgi:hypothetical protein